MTRINQAPRTRRAQRHKERIMTENVLCELVVDAAIVIHKALGSGVYEIVYEVVLTHERKKHDLNVERQVPVSIEYDGIKFDEGYRADIIIENKVIL